jgi:hypothetical protein
MAMMMKKYNKQYILWGTILCCTPLLYSVKQTKQKVVLQIAQNRTVQESKQSEQQASISNKKDKEEADFWALVHLLSVCKIQ